MQAQLSLSDAERDAAQAYDQTLQQAISTVSEQGCLILKNLFPRSFIEKLSLAYFEQLRGLTLDSWRQQSVIVGPGRLMSALKLQGLFSNPRFWAHPVLYPILQTLLGPEFVLDVCTTVNALPGALDQALHRDNNFPFGYHAISTQMPPFALTISIPLIDVTAQTGLTELYPGSHQLLEPTQAFAGRPSLKPELQLGDVLAFDYRLVHRGLANSSQMIRPLVYLIYTRPWYIDSMNHLENNLASLLIEPGLQQKLPPQLARLLIRAQTD